MAEDVTELALASLELDKLEACVELMFLTAYADGVVRSEERAVFEAHVRRATGGQLRPDLVRAVLDHVEGSIDVAKREGRLRAIAERLVDPKLRRASLALAAEVANADGRLTEQEISLLMLAGSLFGVDKAEVHRMIATVKPPVSPSS